MVNNNIEIVRDMVIMYNGKIDRRTYIKFIPNRFYAEDLIDEIKYGDYYACAWCRRTCGYAKETKENYPLCSKM